MNRSALDSLRNLLTNVKPAGSDGFEGLVAEALAEMTGLVFRLAKSGSQFGRDASTPSGSFAIAMEAKRYRDKMTLDALVGKAGIAALEKENKIDLWVLAATSEVGDDIQSKLSEILEKSGITLLTLDWTEHSLPHLAVLLASVKDLTIAWFKRNLEDCDSEDLEDILEGITQNDNFLIQKKKLVDSLCASKVGLDSLRRKSTSWLQDRFSNAAKSQVSFGQYIAFADPTLKVISRVESVNSLERVIADFKPGISEGIIAVFGEEGCGKTWVIAEWFSKAQQKPIVLFVAGRRSESLDPRDPIKNLAKLIVEQDGLNSTQAIDSWMHRLDRWKTYDVESDLRFVVVLDGLNEHPNAAWADIIKAMQMVLSELGGCLIVSCRPAFWQRDISPRLKRIEVHSVNVTGYSESELELILIERDININCVPERVREFICNPRVCSVAINLIDRLERLEELTKERLLLEYWQARLEERGNSLSHNVAQFHKLLRNHAAEWLRNRSVSFDPDEWKNYSPVARNNNSINFDNDVTEIMEGRFLQLSDEGDSYRFTEQGLPFALGLLIIEELKSKTRSNNASELLHTMLEPILGFDIIGDALITAIGLACLDSKCPQEIRVSLIELGFALQNFSEDGYLFLVPHVYSCPEAFLDVIELEHTSVREHEFLTLLVAARTDSRVEKALLNQIPLWLGRWSRNLSWQTNDELGLKRQSEFASKIISALADLKPAEQSYMVKFCEEKKEVTSWNLLRVIAVLIAGRPQAHLANALLASKLSIAVAPDFHKNSEALAWAIRLNTRDFQDLENQLNQIVDDNLKNSSETFSRACSYALNLLGSQKSSARSENLLASNPGLRVRRVENLCDTNPYDPKALVGSNFENARSLGRKICGEKLWTQFGHTTEDGDFDDVSPSLIRFEPDIILEVLHTTISSAVDRTGMPLRQLAWHLQEYSPLFSSELINSVMSTYQRLISDTSYLQDHESTFVICAVLNSLLPHFEAEEQLELLLSLPSVVSESLSLRDTLNVLEADRLQYFLEKFIAASDHKGLLRTLLFASARVPKLTLKSREIIVACFKHTDDNVAQCAADVIFVARDDQLDRMLLENVKPYQKGEEKEGRRSWRRRAVAEAVISQNRTDCFALISPEYMGFVLASLDLNSSDLLLQIFSRAINCLLGELRTKFPLTTKLSFDVDSNDFVESRRMIDSDAISARKDQNDDFNKLAKAFNRDDFAARQKVKVAEIESFYDDILNEDAIALTSHWRWNDARLLVQSYPAWVSQWLDMILATSDLKKIRNVYNLGLVLAGTYASNDSGKAVAVLEKLNSAGSNSVWQIGEARVSLYLDILFKNPEIITLDDLRKQAFNKVFSDQEIESVVIAVEMAGAGRWLDNFVTSLVRSAYPGEQARGLTIAGMRHKSEVSESVLAQQWGVGFLGNVAAYARKVYKKNEWAYHWFQLSLETTCPTEFWRYSVLAAGIADIRYCRWLDDVPQSELTRKFGVEYATRLRKAAEARTKKRKDTLFGLKAPDSLMVHALQH